MTSEHVSITFAAPADLPVPGKNECEISVDEVVVSAPSNVADVPAASATPPPTPPKRSFDPVIDEFDKTIQADSLLYQLTRDMWREPSMSAIYTSPDPAVETAAARQRVRSYDEMLARLDTTLRQAPEWSAEKPMLRGGVGLPMAVALHYAMSTPSGHLAFAHRKVNEAIQKVLRRWGEFLESPESAYVLPGWLGHDAKAAMMAVANGYNKTNHSFESFFKCNPAQPNLGFRSWDDFFARHIADMNALRPVASPQDDNVIASACEAIPFAIATGIKPRDDFWIKEQRYSVVDMLDDAAAAERFAGGTVYQGLLLSLAYHRWHAPVAGVVRSARVVDGTYYSTPMFTSPGEDGSGVRMEEFEHVVYAQGYMAHRATRAVIMIDAHNAAIGTVAFVAVGMLEVSSCEITVKEGERIAKGQDMGSFHFGGSSHCLVFGKHVRLEGLPGVGADASVAVRSKLAEVVVGV